MSENNDSGGSADQVKAENVALKALLEQQKSTIDKHEVLIQTLRKVESRSQRTETIVKDAVAAMRQGIPENFLKIAETLPLETQWAMYKAFPRPDLAPAESAKTESVTASKESAPQIGAPKITATPFMPQPEQPVAPAAQSPASPRPVAPQIESPFEREKSQMKAQGTLNMHTMLELIRKHNNI